MAETQQNQILDALYAAMKPIARFLLRSGISYREFNDILKAAFVDVATQDYGIRGRPTNISRVAVMTGLTRKEVKRLREYGEHSARNRLSKRSPPAEVLHYWFTDPEYLDSNNLPKILPYDGSDISFTALTRKCAGDIPPGAMRTELKRVGAIVEKEGGSLEAVRREFVSIDADARVVAGLNLGLRPLATTIAHNTNPQVKGDVRFQRLIFSQRIPLARLENLQTAATRKLIKISEELDDDFAELEAKSPHSREKLAGNAGVGIFYFVEED